MRADWRSFGLTAVNDGQMPRAGVEPAWACARWILSPVRLPVSPPRQWILTVEKGAGARNLGSRSPFGPVCFGYRCAISDTDRSASSSVQEGKIPSASTPSADTPIAV